jgi:pimeloyl-ACP methyl ester carboxylesterase
MAFADIDGIATRYEIIGSGPPLLMQAPAGFDATLEKWTTQGVYARIKLLDYLPKHYTCIVFDRRECGQSGGRVERVTWAHYARQARGLLEYLKIERAHLMGGCMGCCAVIAFAVLHPRMVQSMVLFWPVGGAKYRITCHQRFAQHLAFVQQTGLAQVAELASSSGKSFGEDPRGGPWASVLRHDSAFSDNFSRLDADKYRLTVTAMGRALFDRDTSPGAEPEDLMQLNVSTLIVPGRDASHATSAARYLEECIPDSEYWDVPVAAQTEETTAVRILEFLAKADS